MLKYITAKFDSVCAETGKPIKKGDRVVYNDRTRRAYASGSPTQQQFMREKPRPKRRKKDKYYNWQTYNDR